MRASHHRATSLSLQAWRPAYCGLRPRSWRRPPQLPLHHDTALQHWRQGAYEESDVMLRPMLSPLGFRIVRSDERIHSLGRFHIGGSAYWEWALPPNVRRGVLPGWGVNMLFILPNSVQREGVPGEAARCTGEAFTTLLTQQRDAPARGIARHVSPGRRECRCDSAIRRDPARDRRAHRSRCGVPSG